MEARRAQGFLDHEIILRSPAQQWKIVGNSVDRKVAFALGLSLQESWSSSDLTMPHQNGLSSRIRSDIAQVVPRPLLHLASEMMYEPDQSREAITATARTSASSSVHSDARVLPTPQTTPQYGEVQCQQGYEQGMPRNASRRPSEPPQRSAQQMQSIAQSEEFSDEANAHVLHRPPKGLARAIVEDARHDAIPQSHSPALSMSLRLSQERRYPIESWMDGVVEQTSQVEESRETFTGAASSHENITPDEGASMMWKQRRGCSGRSNDRGGNGRDLVNRT